MIKKIKDVCIYVKKTDSGFGVSWTDVWFGKIRRDKELIFSSYDQAVGFYRNQKSKSIEGNVR